MALDLHDKSANGNDLTNHNATEYTTNFPFAASTEAVAMAAASTQYLSAASSASLNISGDLTIEAWVKKSSIGANMAIAGKWSGGAGADSYFLQLNASDVLRFSYSDDGTQNANHIGVGHSDGTITSTTVWHHAAVTLKASTQTIIFYIDGVAQTTTVEVSGPTSIFSSTTDFGVGEIAASAFWWDGQMTQIRIWNIVRTPTQISNNMSQFLTGNESGLVAYWPFQAISLAGGFFSQFF